MSLNLIFLCGARDFHAMDWYRSAQEVIPENKLSILTDLIESEGFKKIVNENDRVDRMLIIDRLLFKKQSSLADIWRNVIKFILLPVQVFFLKQHNLKNPNSIYYAHGMYYIWLGYFANVNFIGTPQGSEILIRPFKSKLYKFLAKKSMQAATFITVDSEKMKSKCEKISSITPFIIQNGIDMSLILEHNKETVKPINRTKVLSIRGFTKLYRIKEIIAAREKLQPITFIYPFYDDLYKNEVVSLMRNSDENIGRVDRLQMYELLRKSIMVVSIPSSDSSPRSVYEAIFCGSVVCITYHPYYDILPQCMKDRIVLVDVNDKSWFANAFLKAKKISKKEFFPYKESLDLFDQRKSFKRILNLLN